MHFHANSQNISKGLDYIAEKEYDKAYEIFSEAINENKDLPAAQFGMAKLLTAQKYPGINFDSAYIYLMRSEANLDSLDAKERDKYKEKYNLTKASIRNLKKKVDTYSYEQVKAKNTFEAFDTYANIYTDSEHFAEISNLRNEQKMLLTDTENKDLDFYKAFFEEYRKYVSRYSFNNKIKKAWMDFYRLYTVNDLDKTLEFEKLYPDFPSRDIVSADKSRLWTDKYKAATPKGTIEEIVNFENQYPSNPIKDKIKKDKEKLWLPFYDNYIAKNGSASVFEFENKFPDFPFKEKLLKDKEKYWMPYYTKYVADGKYQTIVEFEQKYPECPLKDKIKKDKEKTFKGFYDDFTKDGELSTLEEFETYYADSISRDWIKADREVFRKGRDIFYYGTFDSVKAHEYMTQAPTKDLAYVCLQKFCKEAITKKNWTQALNISKKYITWMKGRNKKYDDFLTLLQSNENPIQISSIGEKVNTLGDEIMPVISADSKKLFFCGSDRRDQLGGEDIYMSEFQNGEWQNPVLVPGLNTTNNEAALSISADGNQMIIFGSAENGAILSSQFTTQGWSKPELVAGVNSPAFDADAMMSSDGNALLFVSDRKGNIGLNRPKNKFYHGDFWGNLDIYAAIKENGKWSKIVNLGKKINTPYCERTPFLHPDMKTLYFCSDGYAGFGGLDLYKSVRMNDSSWTDWSPPVNLGKAINTAYDDWGFVISTDGSKAYFSREVNKNLDILSFELSQLDRPEAVATISGKITDNKNNPLEAIIRWEDLSTGKVIGELKSNPTDGNYFIVLPMSKNYGYFVSKDKYYPSSGNIDLRKKTKVDVLQNISLTAYQEIIQEGKEVPLKNLFFEYNKSDIKSESFPELNRLVSFLQSNPSLKIEISGHTDNQGLAATNQALSENRAKAVRLYLIEKKIAESRISAVGYGSSKPIASNDNDEGKAQNRRVEIKAVK